VSRAAAYVNMLMARSPAAMVLSACRAATSVGLRATRRMVRVPHRSPALYGMPTILAQSEGYADLRALSRGGACLPPS